MAVSVFDLFKIGIGPSSSHTVGPMKAARLFVQRLDAAGLLARVARVEVQLYGSLGATGRGHGSDKAVLLGLAGHDPETVDVDAVPALLAAMRAERRIVLAGRHPVTFVERDDLAMLRRPLPFHANGMRAMAFDADGRELDSRTYYSVGGGFVVSDQVAADGQRQRVIAPDASVLPHPFRSGAELLALTRSLGTSIAGVMRLNERHWRDDAEIDAGLLRIWQVMQDCVARGCRTEGVLPGGFKVKRRAPDLHRHLLSRAEAAVGDPLLVMDWVNLYAMAVNEENAAGGRVVTAPTNGAAGIIPAVLHYYDRFVRKVDDELLLSYFLAAAAIGILYKKNASLSGAEVGCQGEVGVACSMAAGALTEILGGSPAIVENAAEIGMEHNLGLTCDPVGGLVQVPCIERNAMGSIKAINAARMALRGDGQHFISLDRVIRTMRDTGADMKSKYKETARGGLAVNIIEC